MARTKADSNGHEAVRELTPQQETALGVLLAGGTDQEAAAAADCSRQTVNGWRNHDVVFIARLNAERQALWAASTDKLRSLVGQAIDVLAQDLDADDPKMSLQAAVHVLRATGIYGADLQPTGPSTPAGVETEHTRQALRDVLF